MLREIAAAESKRGHGARTGWGPKGRSLGNGRLGRRARRELDELDADRGIRRLRVLRPQTRGDCKDGPRPCPWISCSMHLAYDVNPETGALKENFPGLERWELAEPWPRRRKMVWVENRMGGKPGRFEFLVFSGPPRLHQVLDLSPLPDTCALDVADRGAHDLEAIGRLMNVTMERVRQWEEEALESANVRARRAGWAERVSQERLQRIRHAATARRQSEVSQAEALSPWAAVGGREPNGAPCARCGRAVGPPPVRTGFSHARHRAPSGRWCRGTEVSRAGPA